MLASELSVAETLVTALISILIVLLLAFILDLFKSGRQQRCRTEAALEQARKALEPFAKYASRIDPAIGDKCLIFRSTVGDCRAAAKALAAIREVERG